FINALCRTMAVEDIVSSPTFSIINQYKTKNGQTLYHMDLYRIKDENEAITAGVEDCLYSGNICLVEWPDKAAGILPEDSLHLYISSIADNARKLKINL
ncbi:MAG: tRNA (adenosine(37)-N6)-threonylcarbamoyltransferase complex ATPase subunit type 1 TsaE, partial [Ferruginibacter sp.]